MSLVEKKERGFERKKKQLYSVFRTLPTQPRTDDADAMPPTATRRFLEQCERTHSLPRALHLAKGADRHKEVMGYILMAYVGADRRQLNLSHYGVNATAISALAASLPLMDETDPDRLLLAHNTMADLGATALASTLASSAARELDIGYNGIGPQGLAALTEAVALQKNLTSISIAGTLPPPPPCTHRFIPSNCVCTH